MIPGEYRLKEEQLEINAGRAVISLIVINSGDRPVQVGSHFHFYEVNKSLRFDRLAAFGKRLHIPAGTAVRFEPGEEKPVELVEFGGLRQIYGLNGLTSGSAELPKDTSTLRNRLDLWTGGATL